MCLLQLSHYLFYKECTINVRAKKEGEKKKMIGRKAKGKEGKKLSRKDGKGDEGKR